MFKKNKTSHEKQNNNIEENKKSNTEVGMINIIFNILKFQ